MTSSLGRLFDGMAFLLGLCKFNRYEAEAPMALETAAWTCSDPPGLLPFDLIQDEKSKTTMIKLEPMIRAVLEGRQDGQSKHALARAFHDTLAEALGCLILRVASQTSLKRVALSGGCFANGLLLNQLVASLKRAGLEVFLQKQVPPGDGGIALGQAVVAAAQLRRGDS
jgi:hydrogenase maturation protein HypF